MGIEGVVAVERVRAIFLRALRKGGRRGDIEKGATQKAVMTYSKGEEGGDTVDTLKRRKI